MLSGARAGPVVLNCLYELAIPLVRASAVAGAHLRMEYRHLDAEPLQKPIAHP